MNHFALRFGSRLLAVGLVLGICNLANASGTLINFDDLDTSGGFIAIPGGYGGLTWNNFEAINGNSLPQSGYFNGIVSANNVAFNDFGNPALFSSGSSFALTSAYFTAAWNDGLTITVTGFDSSNQQIDTTSFVVNTQGPSLITFDWSGVSSVDFSAAGGTNHGYPGQGTQFAMDNVLINGSAAVPEPSSMIMAVTASMVGIGVYRKAGRRRANP